MSLIDVQFRWLKREKCKVTCNKSGAVIKTEYDGVLQCRRLIMREGQITRGSDGVLQGGCRTEWEEWKDVPDVMEERSDEH